MALAKIYQNGQWVTYPYKDYDGSAWVERARVWDGVRWQTVRAPTEYSDDFNRANAANLGPDWTTRSGTMQIVSNVAQASGDGNYATYNHPLATNDIEVTASITTASQATVRLVIGAHQSNATAVVAELRPSIFGASSINTQTGTWGSLTARATTNISFSNNDTFTFRRVGNTYTVLQNGSPTALTWQDFGDIHPRNYDYRLVGLGLGTTIFVPVATVADNWQAKDVT